MVANIASTFLNCVTKYVAATLFETLVMLSPLTYKEPTKVTAFRVKIMTKVTATTKKKRCFSKEI